MLKKYAIITIEKVSEVTPEVALSAEGNMERFRQLTAEVRRVAPRSDEFTYFVCRAIHAMEAGNYNPVTKEFSGDGHIIQGENGKCKVCGEAIQKWQNGLWHSKSSLEPYCNQNGDAFPEVELLKDVEIVDASSGDRRKIKAYETFIGRGLFVNHASEDAEKIRGIILDASWDPASKGVDILVACDKVAYPELARQIQMGYSNDVSMGTQVQYSLCSICGNKAVTESDYCDHVRNSKGLRQAGGPKVYEVNNGLNFIEISVVSNGADPRAKIKTVLAHLNQAIQDREAKLNSCISPIEANKIRDEIASIQVQLKEAIGCNCKGEGEKTQECSCKQDGTDVLARKQARHKLANKLAISFSGDVEEETYTSVPNSDVNIKEGVTNMSERKAYFQGAGGLNDPAATPYEKEDYTKVRDTQDKQMVGKGMEPGAEGLAGDDLKVKEQLHRASLEQRRQARHAILQKAYFQGGGGLNDPEATPYEKEDYAKVRDTQDKQMVGKGMEPGAEGLAGDDLKVKEQLQRAKLRARFVTADTREKSSWTLYAGATPILSATADELYGKDLDAKNEDNPEVTNWQWVASEAYGRNLIKAVKELGFDAVKAQVKQAQELPPLPLADEAPAEEAPLGGPEALPEEMPEEMSPQEQINAALDKIRSAVSEIEALNQGAKEPEAMEAEVELHDTEKELEGLAEPLALASTNKDVLGVIKEALSDAEKIVARATKIISTKKTAAPAAPAIQKVAEAKEEAKKEIDKAEKALEKAEDKLGVQESAEEEKKEHGVKEEKKEEKKEASSLVQERKAARHKLASELYGLTDGDMIDEAHPQGGTCTLAGGEKLEGDAHVETVKEQQEADMDVAEKEPRGELVARQNARRAIIEKVAEEKKELPEFIKEKVEEAKEKKEEEKKEEPKAEEKKEEKKAEAAPAQVKEAAADGEAKKYYTEMFSESATGNKADPACKSFGGEMTQDFHAKKQTASLNELKTRMKRAYKVALKQQKLGQIEDGEPSLELQVDRLTNLSTPDFEALEAVVENTSVVKEAHVERPMTRSAGAVRVGQTGPGEEEFEALRKLGWK